MDDDPLGQNDFERIVACVNACREMSDEMLQLAAKDEFKLAVVLRAEPQRMVVSVEKAT